MAKNLTEKDILRIMREEWQKRLTLLNESSEDIDLAIKAKVKGKEKNLLSGGLKIKRKPKKGESNSNIVYTISSIGSDKVELTSPEGDVFTVSHDDLEKNYYLD